MPNDYATRQEVKDHLPDPAWGTKYDALIDLLLPRASRLIDEESNEKAGGYFVDSDSTVYLDGTGTKTLHLWREPSVRFLADTPTSIKISEDGSVTPADYTALAATDYILRPYNAPDYGQPYRKIDMDDLNGDYAAWPKFPKAVEITGPIGWSTTVPPTIKEATIVQVVRWTKRAQQMFQDTGAIVELGQLRYTKELDPEVARTVRHFAQEKMTV